MEYIAEIIKVYDVQRQIDVFGLPLVDLVGALTLLIVLLTLYASLKAAKESARANMLSSLPIITLSYDYEKDEIIIENSGSGIATNIKVDSFYNWLADGHFGLYGHNKIEFQKMSLLRHGDRRILASTIKGSVNPFGLTKYAMFFKKEKPLIFAIRFSDLSGQRYITRIKIEDGSAFIVSSPRILNFTNRIKLGLVWLWELFTMVRYATLVKAAEYRHDRVKKKEV